MFITVNNGSMKNVKNFCAVAIAIAVLIFTAVFVAAYTGEQTKTEYLRIHVRANSNSEADQAVKYKVKDQVVGFLTPYAAQCTDKETAKDIISSLLEDIERVCDKTLSENGFTYKSRARVKSEKFPTRVYGNLTLEEGIYDALIIELGTGEGDNWWCVVYPPLCFTSAKGGVEYRSAIYEIIKKFMDD